jgi:hypothetical protein
MRDVSRREAIRGFAGVAALGGFLSTAKFAGQAGQAAREVRGQGSASLLAGPPKPVCGTDYAANTWKTISADTGGLAGFRAYAAPAAGIPAAWPGSVGVIPATATLPVISIKPDIPTVLSGSLDAQLAAYFALVSAGAWVTLWHEGDSAANGFTTAQIIGLHSHVYPIFKANAPATASYVQITTGYTGNPLSSHYPLSQWVCCPANGGPMLDVYGMDSYADVVADTASSIWNRTMFGLPGTHNGVASVAAGGQFAITETGIKSSLVAAGGESRANWYNDSYAFAKANSMLACFTYWDAPGSTSGYAWDATDTATIAALSAINAASKS